MAQRWRYVRNGQECGPVTTADLRLLADQERLLPTDMVCKDGSTQWVKAGSVKGLFYTGPGSRGGSGGRLATCLIAVGLIGLLAAGGGIGAVYYLHGFGGNTPSVGAPDTGPPPTPPADGDSPTKDLSPPPPDLGGSVSGVGKARILWRSGKGSFEHESEDQWVEKNEDGVVVHSFVMKYRNDKYIELFDKSRRYTVRLYGDHCEVEIKDKEKPDLELPGTWETP